GAVLLLLYLGGLAWGLMRSDSPLLRGIGKLLLLVLWIQLGLGVSNVLFSLPLWVAVAHNGVAALLLLTLVTVNHLLNREIEEALP
ncbi:MAG TPA: heme A synthase, partial [Gammaproteobacteria bacterium]|nr:heme A synthase [Gammaproteobacteria bacterium]